MSAPPPAPTVERVTGAAASAYLRDLAALRVEVFREFPYLYEGNFDSETKYLRGYAASARSTLAIARQGDRVVGVATALPLEDHAEHLAPTLRAAGYDPAHVYYFGESVLRRDQRGRGVGHAFFDVRENAARAYGFEVAAFCAVERSPQHPRRPADYHSHDLFWTKRGFIKRPDIATHMTWRDLDEDAESPKRMTFWIKELKT
jgi:GNAT superfamily N-acetyltransferase